ncbi:MAG: TPM domain-containing protein [Ruminococcaceae bacterium]|nr:TPM domain-containing protein [Oscillospiraceae bacterium]
MKKKILIFLFVLVVAFSCFSPVLATNHPPRLIDNADLLTSAEESELLSALDEISERQKLDIIVVTVNSLNGKSPRAYADDYYDQNNYGFGSQKDGVLLLVAMETRDYYISTSGYGIRAFTDAGIKRIGDSIVNDLGDEDYISAFTTYAELCDDYIKKAKAGTPYDADNMPKGRYEVMQYLLISLVIGFIVALIVTGIMRSKLKSVRFKSGASDYMKKDSFMLTQSKDIYLYRNVTRRAKPKDNNSGGSSTHGSSSGRSHGGGGGKF